LVNFEPQDIRRAKDIFKVGYEYARNFNFEAVLKN